MKIIIFIVIFFLNTHTLAKQLDVSSYHIDSDYLKINENPLIAKFIGNVYARNIVNNFWGDEIIAIYDSKKKLILITIKGNVKIKRNNEIINGDYAEYNLKEEKIQVIGNVNLLKDGNNLKGNELNVDLIKSISIMNGNINNQVEAKIVK